VEYIGRRLFRLLLCQHNGTIGAGPIAGPRYHKGARCCRYTVPANFPRTPEKQKDFDEVPALRQGNGKKACRAWARWPGPKASIFIPALEPFPLTALDRVVENVLSGL